MSSIAFSTNELTESQARGINKGRLAQVGLATTVAATLANILVYILGDAVVGYDPDFLILESVISTITMTVIPAVIATLLYGVLLRFTRNPARIFTRIAAVVFVVSLIPDFTLVPGEAGSSSGQIAVLLLMHIVAATIIVRLLTTHARPAAR